MKKLLLIILFSSFVKFSPAQVQIPLSIELSSEAKKNKFFKIFLISEVDTVVKINSIYFPIIIREFNEEVFLNKTNTLEIYYSKDASKWKKEIMDFKLSGNEKSISCKIEFLSHSEILSDLSVNRNYEAKDIQIIDDWSGLIGDSPKYKLINNSSLILRSRFNEFWGETYKLVNNKWEFESNGGICAMRSEGSPFKPGDTITSRGAEFIGDNYAVQEKGKYKYSLEMCTGDALSFWKTDSKNYPNKNVNDVYFLEKEFEITSDSVYYPRSTYEKKIIEGVKHLKSKKANINK